MVPLWPYMSGVEDFCMMQRHKCVFLYINTSFFGVAINLVIVYCLGCMYIEIQYKYEI